MHVVTLTSDWNNDDYYSGSVTGTILSSCKEVTVVTLSNRIKSYSIAEAAFVVRNSYKHFPEGSIHIIAVGTGSEQGMKMLGAKFDGHYFFTADNGIIGLLGDHDSIEVVVLNPSKDTTFTNFPTLFILSRSACRIINGEEFSALGEQTESFRKQIPLRATLENNTITGAVIYVDSFGNAITNISKDLFNRFGESRDFSIYVQSKHYMINTLSESYSECPEGELLALFNSINLLEIAIRNGSAKNLLNLTTDSTIRVEFK